MPAIFPQKMGCLHKTLCSKTFSVVPLAVWRKVGSGKIILLFLNCFFIRFRVTVNIKQELVKKHSDTLNSATRTTTRQTTGEYVGIGGIACAARTIPPKTYGSITDDANCLVSVKLRKQTKNCANILGFNKNFRNGLQQQIHEFLCLRDVGSKP